MDMAAPLYYSADMVRALPDDGNRYETVHGELLVTPAPRALHQHIVKRLLVKLESYLERESVGSSPRALRPRPVGCDGSASYSVTLNGFCKRNAATIEIMKKTMIQCMSQNRNPTSASAYVTVMDSTGEFFGNGRSTG